MATTKTQSTRFVSQLAILCIGGLIGIFAAACGGGSSSSDCSSGQYKFDGQCRTKCDKPGDCASGEKCRDTSEDFGICLPDGGSTMDTGMGGDDTTGGGGDDTSGGGGDDTSGGGGDDTSGGGDDTSGGGDDTTGGDDTSSGSCTNPGELTCGGIYSCLSSNNCFADDNNNQAECVQNCVDKGNCDARDQYGKLDDCRRDNCSAMDAAATCVLDNCKTEYEDCGLTGSASCSDSFVCSTKCERKVLDNAMQGTSTDQLRQDINKCVSDECEDGTVDAQKKRTAISSCARGDNDANKDCTTMSAAPACIWDNCSQEFQTCGVLGSKTCTGMDQCIAECSDGDYECEAKCLWQGSAEARGQRAAVQSCRGQCQEDHLPSSGQPSVDDVNNYADCAYKDCSDKLDACGKVGTEYSMCSGMTDCLSNCPTVGSGRQERPEPTCANECSWGATGEVQAKYLKGQYCLRNQLQMGSKCVNDCCDLSDNNCSTDEETTCLNDCLKTECPNADDCNMLQMGM